MIIRYQGYADVLKVLIDLKYDVHTPDETGKTTLVFGAEGGSIECVQLLLNNKCDPNICYKEKSPLYIASLQGHTEIVGRRSFITYIRISFIIQQHFDNLCVTLTGHDV
jgi:ankyrin repeat protein